MTSDDHVRIEVTADGPYQVRGDLPIVRTAPIETEYGEPVDWEPDAHVDAPAGPSSVPMRVERHEADVR